MSSYIVSCVSVSSYLPVRLLSFVRFFNKLSFPLFSLMLDRIMIGQRGPSCWLLCPLRALQCSLNVCLFPYTQTLVWCFLAFSCVALGWVFSGEVFSSLEHRCQGLLSHCCEKVSNWFERRKGLPCLTKSGFESQFLSLTSSVFCQQCYHGREGLLVVMTPLSLMQICAFFWELQREQSRHCWACWVLLRVPIKRFLESNIYICILFFLLLHSIRVIW